MITQERLKELVNYDPETGIFTAKIQRHGSKAKPGDVLGSRHKKGYLELRLDGRLYLLHRLAFLYMRGYMPQYVDHKDLDKQNNAWDNLREADGSEQIFNQAQRKNNTSGERGVSYEQRDRVWVAKLEIRGQAVVLYRGRSKQKAVEAARAFRKANHGEFYRER